MSNNVDVDNTQPISIDHLAFAYALTGSEKEVCRYVVDGWSNADIAEKRSVSPETIKSQVAAIMRKTKTNSRTQLVRLSIKTSPPVRVT